MNKGVGALLTSLAFFLSMPSASAGVVVLATLAPESISVGETVELDFKLTLFSDPGDFGAFLKGGAVTLFSGDGQQKTFSIAPPGGDSREFIWDVTYSTAGNFIPSYKGEVTYREFYLDKDCDGWGYHQRCSYELEHKDKAVHLKGLFSDPEVHENEVTVAAAPELSTWAMMLIGFAGLGLVAYRRARTRAVTALA